MISFVSRNLKVFFRDKTAVFFSLLAVLIVLGLYIFFLGDVWVDSFPNIKGVKNLMNCWIIAELIGVTSVTANMGAFGTMIEDKSKNKIKDFYVDLDWKHQYAGIFSLKWEGVTFYFIDNLEYFDRPNAYGYDDDAERFIFFSKAATLLGKEIDFKPDIIHANDWHTALVNIYVNDFRKGDHYFDDIRTLFTIHNLKYQGVFDSGYLTLTGLDGYYFNEHDLKYFDAINFMKGGIGHLIQLQNLSQVMISNYSR